MALSADQVRKVANLARLKLGEDEVAALTGQMSQILDYVTMLDQVDTTSVEPMVHAMELRNVFRNDDLVASLPRPAALENAPRTDGKFFLVPQVIGRD